MNTKKTIAASKLIASNQFNTCVMCGNCKSSMNLFCEFCGKCGTLMRAVAFLLLTFFILCCHIADAALPPEIEQARREQYEKDMKKQCAASKEVVVVGVSNTVEKESDVDVSQLASRVTVEVIVQGKVIKVERSKSGLKIGDKITLRYRYNTYAKGAVGPQLYIPTAPRKGADYRIFMSVINKKKNLFMLTGGDLGIELVTPLSSIRFQCPSCKALLDTDSTELGMKIECGKCHNIVTAPNTRFSPGILLGEFVIKQELNRGNLTITLKAYQLSMQREVLFRILKPEYSDSSDNILAFIKEIRGRAKVKNPQPCEPLGLGKASGIFYQVYKLHRNKKELESIFGEHL